jgi:hypothetical protein
LILSGEKNKIDEKRQGNHRLDAIIDVETFRIPLNKSLNTYNGIYV